MTKGVKTIDLLKEGMLMPPRPDVCQECATKHDPLLCHNAQSLYYQYKFKKEHDRWPTWEDAMAHCNQAVKDMVIKTLEENKVDWRNHEK